MVRNAVQLDEPPAFRTHATENIMERSNLSRGGGRRATSRLKKGTI